MSRNISIARSRAARRVVRPSVGEVKRGEAQLAARLERAASRAPRASASASCVPVAGDIVRARTRGRRGHVGLQAERPRLVAALAAPTRLLERPVRCGRRLIAAVRQGAGPRPARSAATPAHSRCPAALPRSTERLQQDRQALGHATGQGIGVAEGGRRAMGGGPRTPSAGTPRARGVSAAAASPSRPR